MIREVREVLFPRTAKPEKALKKTASELKQFLEDLSSSRSAILHDAAKSDIKEVKSRNRGFKLPDQSTEDISQKNSALLHELKKLAAKSANESLSEEEQQKISDNYQAVLLKLVSTGNSDFINALKSTSIADTALASATVAQIDDLQKTLKTDVTVPQDIERNQQVALEAAALIEQKLLTEGAQSAFARFQDISRTNVVGLLKQ